MRGFGLDIPDFLRGRIIKTPKELKNIMSWIIFSTRDFETKSVILEHFTNEEIAEEYAKRTPLGKALKE